MTKTGNRGMGPASLWPHWPSWAVLLCLGLMPAAHALCFAADPPAAPAYNLTAPPARAPAAVLRKVEAAKPAGNRGLLGTIVEALGDDRDADMRRRRVIEDQNARNMAAVGDQNVRTMEVRLRPQFQQLLYVELAFLRRACQPDAKPFAEVAKAAKAELQAPLHEYVVTRYSATSRPRPGSNSADPRSEVKKLLMPLVEAKLGPEKTRLYRQECEKRAEARKHAVVLNLVALLDERLDMTAQQRAKLVESFSANYESGWDPFVEIYGLSNPSLFPSIRDESIIPLLDERQKGMWEQAQKLNGAQFVGRIVRSPMSDAAEIQEIAHIAEEVQDGR